MTAYLPRVGDTITTAAQVRDLPTGVVVRTHNGILCEADGVGLVTPSWYAQGRALEARHLPATVLYVPGDRPSVTRDGMDPLTRAVSDTLDEYLSRHHGIITSHTNPEDFLTWLRENGHEVRPSVTDNARAEAWRRFPDGIDVETGEPVDDYGYPETAREAFIGGAEWAAGRAEADPDSTYHEPPAWCPGCGDRIPTEIIREWGVCSNCYGTTDDPWAAVRAETTTERCGTTGPNGWTCVRLPGHEGQHGHAGCFWAAETTTATTEDIHALDARWFERWETEQPLADKHAGYYQGRVSAIAQCREELLGLLATARTRPTREDLILALARADGQAWPDGMDRHTAEYMYGKQADAVLALLGGDNRG